MSPSAQSSASSSPGSQTSSPGKSKDRGTRKRKAATSPSVNPVPILMSPGGGIVNFQPSQPAAAGQFVAISQAGGSPMPVIQGAGPSLVQVNPQPAQQIIQV